MDKATIDPAGLPKLVTNAMTAIEADFEPLLGVLPKDYGIFEPKVLEDLTRLFNSEQIKVATGDVFGRIYEYFLAKFSIQKAHDNGEFFTPSSLVQTIVNVIEPDHGTVFDPASGSAGMLVQSSHFIENTGGDTSRKVYEFTPEQLQNIAAIVWLYRGQHDRFLALVKDYFKRHAAECAAVPENLGAFDNALAALEAPFAAIAKAVKTLPDLDATKTQALTETLAELRDAGNACEADTKALVADIAAFVKKTGKSQPATNDQQHVARKAFDPSLSRPRASSNRWTCSTRSLRAPPPSQPISPARRCSRRSMTAALRANSSSNSTNSATPPWSS